MIPEGALEIQPVLLFSVSKGDITHGVYYAAQYGVVMEGCFTEGSVGECC